LELAAVLLAASLGGAACGAPPGLVLRVPVIIVDVDTLRADHLGCYGYGRPTSPNIDAFAREANRFDWVFAQAPNTPPSQSSILTGLYPSAHGRIQDAEVLPEGVVTLAEVMRDFGYRTAAFVDGANMSADFGMAQGFDEYDDEAGGLKTIGPKVNEWLGQQASEGFLLFIHTYDAHAPYDDSPEPFNSMFLKGLELPSEDFRKRMTRIMEDRRLSKFTERPFCLSSAELEYAKATYDGGIRYVDEWFGSFCDVLRERGLYENSIIVFISDHGDEFEEHDSVFHERLYAAVTRIPLLIRLPGPPLGQVIEQTVESIDLMPTLLELVGASSPRFLHGRSLLPLIQGGVTFDELAFSESPFFGRRIAVANRHHRLIFTESGAADELYGYRSDPLEQKNRIGDDSQVAAGLAAEVGRWKSLVEGKGFAAVTVTDIAPETAAQLRALGYLDEQP
jgi:arylsulfatase A-like enzyme